jgi:hypothetical protein
VRSFSNEVEAYLTKEVFARLGFVRKQGRLRKELGPGSCATLGLVLRTGADKAAHVFVVIGVFFEAVYASGRELGAYPDAKNATLSIPLRYVVAPVQEGLGDYDFAPGQPNTSEYERIAADVVKFAFPVYEKLATIDSAFAVVQRKEIPDLNGVSEFVPLVHLLRGEIEQAVRSANDWLSRMDASRGSGRQYAEFVSNLKKRCSM